MALMSAAVVFGPGVATSAVALMGKCAQMNSDGLEVAQVSLQVRASQAFLLIGCSVSRFVELCASAPIGSDSASLFFQTLPG